MRILLLFCIPLFLSSLTGCTMLKQPIFSPEPCPPKLPCGEVCEPEYDPIAACSVEGQLTTAAKSIERSLFVLAAAKESDSPPVLLTAPLITPEGGMGNTADIDWTGPIGPLVEKIAAMTDYRVKVLGNEPAIPIIVTITAKRGVIAEILQNASFQVARRAHIVVFPCSRVIELRYIA